MLVQLQQCQSWIDGSLLNTSGVFEGISTDTRTIRSGNLFVALSGDRYDAHDYLAVAVDKGAAALMVRMDVPQAKLENINVPILKVTDTKHALACLAQGFRQLFDIPVIGVTGSNGKTTVKEMLASILEATYGNDYVATRGNLNNKIGVPLTISRFDPTTQAAVVEMGMNHPGEIALLSEIAQVSVGLVNNAQREHQEFMRNVEAVAVENGAVLRHLPSSGVAVFPADDEFSMLWASYAIGAGVSKIITFGLNPNATVYGTYESRSFGSKITIQTEDANCDVELQAAGEHNVRNALAATACALGAGISLGSIARGLEAFSPVQGRMQRKQAGLLTVIDDTYNANPDSAKAAIDVLSSCESSGKRILVLGDMGEVGEQGPLYHREIGAYALSKGVDVVVTLGDIAQETTRAFGEGACHANTREELHTELAKHMAKNSVVLVKGSRFMKMEQTVQHLLSQQV